MEEMVNAEEEMEVNPFRGTRERPRSVVRHTGIENGKFHLKNKIK